MLYLCLHFSHNKSTIAHTSHTYISQQNKCVFSYLFVFVLQLKPFFLSVFLYISKYTEKICTICLLGKRNEHKKRTQCFVYNSKLYSRRYIFLFIVDVSPNSVEKAMFVVRSAYMLIARIWPAHTFMATQ